MWLMVVRLDLQPAKMPFSKVCTKQGVAYVRAHAYMCDHVRAYIRGLHGYARLICWFYSCLGRNRSATEGKMGSVTVAESPRPEKAGSRCRAVGWRRRLWRGVIYERISSRGVAGVLVEQGALWISGVGRVEPRSAVA